MCVKRREEEGKEAVAEHDDNAACVDRADVGVGEQRRRQVYDSVEVLALADLAKGDAARATARGISRKKYEFHVSEEGIASCGCDGAIALVLDGVHLAVTSLLA